MADELEFLAVFMDRDCVLARALRLQDQPTAFSLEELHALVTPLEKSEARFDKVFRCQRSTIGPQELPAGVAGQLFILIRPCIGFEEANAKAIRHTRIDWLCHGAV